MNRAVIKRHDCSQVMSKNREDDLCCGFEIFLRTFAVDHRMDVFLLNFASIHRFLAVSLASLKLNFGK